MLVPPRSPRRTSWNPAEPWWKFGGTLVEPWWNPGGTLVVEPSWNLTSGPPRTTRSLSGLRPQSFQLLGKIVSHGFKVVQDFVHPQEVCLLDGLEGKPEHKVSNHRPPSGEILETARGATMGTPYNWLVLKTPRAHVQAGNLTGLGHFWKKAIVVKNTYGSFFAGVLGHKKGKDWKP